MLGEKKSNEKKAVITEKPKMKRVHRRGNEDGGLLKDGPSFVFPEDDSEPESIGAGKFLLSSFPQDEDFEEEPVESTDDSSLVENTTVPLQSSEAESGEEEVLCPKGTVPSRELVARELPDLVPLECTMEIVKKAEDEKYAVSSTLRGSKVAKPKSVIEKVRKTASVYNARNTGIYSENVEVQYHAENLLEVHVTEDGRMLMPNRRVYFQGLSHEWDRVNEVRVAKGREIELDLGVSLTLPDNYELEISGVHDLRLKFGLELIGGIIRVNRQTSVFPIVLRLKAVEELAYIQRYQSIVQARLSQV